MTARLTAERLAEIRASLAGITDGPWTESDSEILSPHMAHYGGRVVGRKLVAQEVHNHNDAIFIAAARTDLPALCDEVEALAKERDEWKGLAQELRVQANRVLGVLAAASDVPCDLPEGVTALREQRNALRAELARVTAERDAWQARANETAASLQQFVDEMGAKLATAEADNARLREALLTTRSRVALPYWLEGAIDAALAPAPNPPAIPDRWTATDPNIYVRALTAPSASARGADPHAFAEAAFVAADAFLAVRDRAPAADRRKALEVVVDFARKYVEDKPRDYRLALEDAVGVLGVAP